MIEVKVKTILSVIHLLGGRKEQIIQLDENTTVFNLLNHLTSLYGIELMNKLFDDKGNIKRGIAMFVNGRNIFALDGMDTLLNNEDEFLIFPPVGGG